MSPVVPIFAGVARAKAARGERLSRAERVAIWADTIDTELEPLLKAGKIRGAIVNVMRQLASSDIAKSECLDGLLDRMAELESAVGRVLNDRIMARPAPSQKQVFKRNDDALVQPAGEQRLAKHARLVASGSAAHARGERPTVEEMREMKIAECAEELDKIFQVMKEKRSAPGRGHAVLFSQGEFDGIRAAIAHLSFMIKLTESWQIERRWAVEDRLAELKAAAKRT